MSVEYISSYAILTIIFWVKTQSKVTFQAILCSMDGHKCLFEIQYLWKLCVMPWSLVTHSYRLDCPSWFGMCNFFAYSGQMMVTKHRVVTESGNGSRNDVMCLFSNFEKGCDHIGLPRPFHTERKPTNEFCFWVAQIFSFCE